MNATNDEVSCVDGCSCTATVAKQQVIVVFKDTTSGVLAAQGEAIAQVNHQQ
jgi:hypothetical protein